MADQFTPSVFWGPSDKRDDQWNLFVRREEGRIDIVAQVWTNGTWHTFDHHGVGGENDCEVSLERAKVEAAASAVAQGFI